jgi:response regulator RpfG family c-di-GMP phosphodiesterase
MENLLITQISERKQQRVGMQPPKNGGRKGDPCGLKGEQIPLMARIFALVDVWDALISDRPYRQAWSEEKARQHIQDGAGRHLRPQVVKTFFLEHG